MLDMLESARTPRAYRIHRPELLAQLDGCAQHTLTLVIAPAGSGKSTLLNQWQQSHGHDVIVRINLNPRHLTPLSFLHQLNHHLRQALPHFPILSLNTLTTDAIAIETVVFELVDALNQETAPVFILIDDFHVVIDPVIQRIVADVLLQLADHIHVVLASRSQPAFSISQLKLEDRLLLINQTDLRLDAAYLPALCTALGVPLPQQHYLKELLNVTEGWFAGLKLALLARQPAQIDALAQNQTEWISYFADVVFAGLPADEQEFLLVTSILDSFHVPLCQHLLATPHTSDLLETILHKGLFMQPIEEQIGWYRYHPLFKKFLYQRLQRESQTRLKALHLAAAQYYLSLEDDESALLHAHLAGQDADYLVMLQQSCERQLRMGKFSLILHHLQTLDHNLLRSNATLFIPHLAALIFTRQFIQARYGLDALRQHHEFMSQPAVVRQKVDYLEKLLALFQDDDGLWTNAAYFEDAGIPYGDLRDSLRAMAARHYLLNGECTQAIQIAYHAKILLNDLQQEYLASYADVIAILAERELGHILAARQMTVEFYQRYAHQPHTPCWLTASTCMAVSLYEQNRASDAQTLCDQLIQGVDASCATEMVYYAYVITARLHDIAGQAMRGHSLLLQLRRILRQGRYQRLLNQLLAEELSQAIRTQHLSRVQAIAEEYGLTELMARQVWQHTPTHYREGWMYGGLAAALYLRTQQQYDQALQILQHVIQMLQRCEMRTRLVVAEANYLVILQLQGRQALALKLLGELFARVGLQCAVRTVFDEAPGFGDLLYLAHQQGQVHLPDVFLQTYANIVAAPITSVDLPESTLIEGQLTAKEFEILQLVRKGCSNKEISRLLNISLSTTKWHLKNIFTKLNVNTRTAAMAAFETPEASTPHRGGRHLLGVIGLMGCLEFGGLSASLPDLEASGALLSNRAKSEWIMS
jgi:LuxR family transcriptional regulator, maltose regulon positive regulatory protein